MTDASHFDEKLLLAAVAAGDRGAFNQLYSAHINNVYNYIYLFTKSKEETEELLQEVFVHLWEKREMLAEVVSFKNYLFRAAKNRLITNVRHMQVKHRVLSEIRRSTDESQPTTEYDVTYKEYHQVLQRAIAKLPPKRRLIFRLNIENGLSYDEIAHQLHVSKSVVKNQFYKALDFIRQYLAQHGDGSLAVIIILTQLEILELV
jgi:RNA polymerase sigma-70 factor (ECF subfamily)